MKRWMQKRTKVNITQMADALGVHRATAAVLANRGIGTYSGAKAFLEGDIQKLNNPLLMKDMEKGVKLIWEAIRRKQKIVVYGDYDVDGVTSATILYKAIVSLGGNVSYYLPHRQKEGYGLNEKAVYDLAKEGAQVIFTCDNGIAAIPEIDAAKELGMTVVVLDHHEPGYTWDEYKKEEVEMLPRADALIDPKQRMCQYPYRHMCAGGLAYQFARGLFEHTGKGSDALLKEFQTLAAVATVCDIVDLTGENRIIVKQGLENIKKSGNVGLTVLLEEAGLLEQSITEYHLGFIIGPCINAAGRLESGNQSVALLCEEKEEQAREYARDLIRLNQQRKEMTLQAVERITEQLHQGDQKDASVIVAYCGDIHESIAGIVAGRLKEQYYRPVIVLTKGEEMAKGSARSIEGYHVFGELQKCRELFSRFGGHAMAAGLSIPYENIDRLRERLNAACTLTKEQMTPELKIETSLSFSEITIALAKELGRLAPFGKGNPLPLFGTKNVSIAAVHVIGKNKNILRFTLYDSQSKTALPAILFHGYEEFINVIKKLYGVENCDKIFMEGLKDIQMDFVYQIGINSYQGRDSVQLLLQDFRLSQ